MIDEIFVRIIIVLMGVFFTLVALISPKLALDSMKKALKDY